jgi:glyceraldehyde 3-phosphate dehydrogenase
MSNSRLRIGIHGFGRIGRAVFRIIHERGTADVVAINDINPDTGNIAYLLRHDSIHGRFRGQVQAEADWLVVDGRRIRVTHLPHMADVGWQALGVDVLIDATSSKASILGAEAQRSVAAFYVKTHAVYGLDDIRTLMFGVNDSAFDPRIHKRISTSICDAVALCPIVALLEKACGVESGFLTTLHPWLADQQLMDGNAQPAHLADDLQSHYALGRSAINNLIPKSTSALRAAAEILPGIDDRLASLSYRVPTNIVSSAVLQVTLGQATTRAAIIDLFRQAEAGQHWPVITSSVEPRVSLDYAGTPFSAAIDERWTTVQNERDLLLMYWYDNEWGYSSRVVDAIDLIAQGESR